MMNTINKKIKKQIIFALIIVSSGIIIELFIALIANLISSL